MQPTCKLGLYKADDSSLIICICCSDLQNPEPNVRLCNLQFLFGKSAGLTRKVWLCGIGKNASKARMAFCCIIIEELI